jgi:hypothetical protein
MEETRMTRTDIEKRLAEIVTELTFAPGRDRKHEAVADALMALHQAVVFRVEQEFAEHAQQFDPHAVLARLDAEALRRRRDTGPIEGGGAG